MRGQYWTWVSHYAQMGAGARVDPPIAYSERLLQLALFLIFLCRLAFQRAPVEVFLAHALVSTHLEQ